MDWNIHVGQYSDYQTTTNKHTKLFRMFFPQRSGFQGIDHGASLHCELSTEGMWNTDLWDLTRVISSSRERNVVDPCRHVDHDLVLVHGDGWAFSLLQGQDNNRGVVCTKHALFPKQQRRASEATGTRHSLRSLGAKREPGSRRKRMKHFMMHSLRSCPPLSCDDKQETKTQLHFQRNTGALLTTILSWL